MEDDVVERKVKQAIEALSGEERLNAVKFFEENKNDDEFIYFLQLIFGYIKDIEMSSREKLASKMGDDLAYAFLDRFDQAVLASDKRRLEAVVWAEEDDKEDFIDGMKKLLKYLEKSKE